LLLLGVQLHCTLDSWLNAEGKSLPVGLVVALIVLCRNIERNLAELSLLVAGVEFEVVEGIVFVG
jgi:hypothetical protein